MGQFIAQARIDRSTAGDFIIDPGLPNFIFLFSFVYNQ